MSDSEFLHMFDDFPTPQEWMQNQVANPANLTPEEQRIELLRESGLTIRETSQQLGLSPQTIKNQRTTINKKRGARRKY